MDTKNKPRKRKNEEKPLCKYGLSCYQKNPEHRKKFKHPSGKVEGIVKDVNENSLNVTPKIPLKKIEKEIIVTTEDNSSECESENEVETDIKVEESVDEILKTFPKDFFDFWSFCKSVNSLNPKDAFSEFGYHLVGVYDLLAKKVPKDQKVDISCHWRYFYDPPEFQTVIMKTGKALYHIGYFRDHPTEMPSVLASNSANLGAKLTLMGDNIFAAMNDELMKMVNSTKSKNLTDKANKMQKELQKCASKKKYSLNWQTKKTKERQKKVVANTFNGFGIVVPVKNDIGYRTLPESDASLKSILKKIAGASSETERLEHEELLDEIITNVHFANDECDYGTGLELGIDLFCFGDISFHDYILSLLPLAYNLLKRPRYSSIIKAHLKNRRKDSNLSTLDV